MRPFPFRRRVAMDVTARHVVAVLEDGGRPLPHTRRPAADATAPGVEDAYLVLLGETA